MQYIDMHYGQEYFEVPNYPKYCIDNIITITGGEKADYSTTEIAGDMKFSGNLTLDSTLVESGAIVDQKADINLDTFTKTNAEVRAEKLATLVYESHPHFTVATDEVKTFVSQRGTGMVFDLQ
jgi:hypothetical protein